MHQEGFHANDDWGYPSCAQQRRLCRSSSNDLLLYRGSTKYVRGNGMRQKCRDFLTYCVLDDGIADVDLQRLLNPAYKVLRPPPPPPHHQSSNPNEANGSHTSNQSIAIWIDERMT